MLRTAFGTVICKALSDPSVVEIMQNPDGLLWVERAGEGRRCIGDVISADQGERIVRLVASLSGFDVTRESKAQSIPTAREPKKTARQTTKRS